MSLRLLRTTTPIRPLLMSVAKSQSTLADFSSTFPYHFNFSPPPLNFIGAIVRAFHFTRPADSDD